MAERVAQPEAWERLDGASALRARLPERAMREAWKYTRVNRLLASFGSDAGQAEVASSAEVALGPGQASIDTRQFPVGLLTSAQSTPAQLVISQDGDYELRLTSGDHHQISVHVEAGVNATLIERHSAPFNTACLRIQLSAGSSLKHYRLIESEAALWHLTDVDVAADARYQLGHGSTGSELQRIDVRIRLDGRGAEAQVDSAAALGARQHHDLNLEVIHAEPDGRCRLRCHAAVAENATSTCVGRIHIVEDAQRSDAELSCRNLLLADSATANAKPELEIYADDVRCAHGATVGRLDDDALFYLRSRGIDSNTARRMLVRAFLAEPISGPLAEDAVAALERAISTQADVAGRTQ